MPRRNRRKIYRQEKEGFRFDPRKYINKGFDGCDVPFSNAIVTENHCTEDHCDVAKTHPNIQLIRIYEDVPGERYKKRNPNVRKRRAVKAIYDMQRSAVLTMEQMKEKQEMVMHKEVMHERDSSVTEVPLEQVTSNPSTADAPDKYQETTKIQRFIAAVTALTRKYTRNTLAAKTTDQ